MSNKFKGIGNLGKTPELKFIETADGKRAVANFSVRFDRNKRLEDGSYVDNGGFWLDTALFGKQAERVAKVLSKGNRVHVEGSLKLDEWEKEGEPFKKLKLEATYIALDLLGIESVQYQVKNTSDTVSDTATDSTDSSVSEEFATNGEPAF